MTFLNKVQTNYVTAETPAGFVKLQGKISMQGGATFDVETFLVKENSMILSFGRGETDDYELKSGDKFDLILLLVGKNTSLRLKGSLKFEETVGSWRVSISPNPKLSAYVKELPELVKNRIVPKSVS